MFVKIYDKNGKEIGKSKAPSQIFSVKINPDLLHQVVVAQTTNRRRVIAHAKTRAEVRGGGKKPWRQKGTGRARHGSIRSPLWKGGGVTFGPRKNKIFQQKINKKMRRLALFMALAAKAKEDKLILMDDLRPEELKTKFMAKIFKNLPVGNASCLLVLPIKNEDFTRAGRNLAKVAIKEAKDLNALDVLSRQYIVMPKESLKTLEKVFLTPKS